MAIIKKGQKSEFRNLLAIIRLALLNRRTYMAFPKKKFQYSYIMNLLVKNGFILGYEERGELLVIYFKQIYTNNWEADVIIFHTIKQMIRIRRRGTINSRDINNQRRVKGPLELFFVSTDKGILDSSVISKNRVGGFPLFLIK